MACGRMGITFRQAEQNAYGDKINFKPSKELTYKSSNNAVATVTNKGVITAKKKEPVRSR